MPKVVPSKQYTGEFKQMVAQTMMRDKLSCCEAACRLLYTDSKPC